ncbi:hypothetical protein Zmor_015586 [Zophobas morio]|uniref:Cytochrome P450 n=1 Tax=Zophobas morio TaxID=2755281 RepID=A0AA38MHT9_9CUCU|nr:hypothetical protein Zmor_015586 [Zophobas morio]
MFQVSVSSSTVLELLFTFITISVLTWYLYYLYCFNYWKKKGVPTIAPRFPAGNILKPIIGKENLFDAIAKYYNDFKSKGHKHAGLYFFNGPIYFPIDPEIIKNILTTDFDHFMDRGMYFDEEKFPLSAHLFSIEGSKWRNLRTKLSPTFTSGKLKTMYEIFVKMTENFIRTIEPTAQKGGEVNIKYVSANFTADLILSTAFGLEGNTLKNPDNELSQIVTKLFDVPTWDFVKTVMVEGFQNPGKIVKALLSNRSKEYIFTEILKNAVKQRDENNIARKDFLSLLLEVRDREGLSFNEILAQCFLFFLAGFETSSQTISYCIHNLAHNQEIQEKLRSEIFDNLGKDYTKYSYEDIFNLPYLDQVFNETLRLHPALGFLNRICVKNYTVPGTDVVIEEGTPVLIPVLGLQRDPEYFPDPLKFDPERFGKDQSQVPFTFMPFGEGPRFCIGMRYGKLQVKLGLAALLSQFKFLPSPNTPKTIQLDKYSKTLVMTPLKGITVKVEMLQSTVRSTG